MKFSNCTPVRYVRRMASMMYDGYRSFDFDWDKLLRSDHILFYNIFTICWFVFGYIRLCSPFRLLLGRWSHRHRCCTKTIASLTTGQPGRMLRDRMPYTLSLRHQTFLLAFCAGALVPRVSVCAILLGDF